MHLSRLFSQRGGESVNTPPQYAHQTTICDPFLPIQIWLWACIWRVTVSGGCPATFFSFFLKVVCDKILTFETWKMEHFNIHYSWKDSLENIHETFFKCLKTIFQICASHPNQLTYVWPNVTISFRLNLWHFSSWAVFPVFKLWPLFSSDDLWPPL